MKPVAPVWRMRMSAALADALRRCGAKIPTASLLAEVAIAVFKRAFERWIDEPADRDLPQLVQESLDQLKLVAAAG